MKTKKEILQELNTKIRYYSISPNINKLIKKVEEIKILNNNSLPKKILNLLDSELAYYWGVYIGHKNIVRDKVTESRYAYLWAMKIGDREIMRDRVTESQWAYWWAMDIGDKEIMKKRIVEPHYIEEWNKTFPDDPIVILL